MCWVFVPGGGWLRIQLIAAVLGHKILDLEVSSNIEIMPCAEDDGSNCQPEASSVA